MHHNKRRCDDATAEQPLYCQCDPVPCPQPCRVRDLSKLSLRSIFRTSISRFSPFPHFPVSPPNAQNPVHALLPRHERDIVRCCGTPESEIETPTSRLCQILPVSCIMTICRFCPIDHPAWLPFSPGPRENATAGERTWIDKEHSPASRKKEKKPSWSGTHNTPWADSWRTSAAPPYVARKDRRIGRRRTKRNNFFGNSTRFVFCKIAIDMVLDLGFPAIGKRLKSETALNSDYKPRQLS
ncbi:hypothetical protein GGI35DRAFT_3829 [Trichoderma velutinum]